MIVSLTRYANWPNILNDYLSFNFVSFKDLCLPLKSISMPKGHGFALTPYKGALVHLCYETLRNKFNFLK